MAKPNNNNSWKKIAAACGLIAMVLYLNGNTPLHAQESIHLTLESAVNIAMGSSYRIKQLELGIERTRFWLQSRQATLKSRVFMELKAP